MWFCREYCYVFPGYIQRSGVTRPQNVCSLPADTARCSILCGGHVEFLSIHVPQSHSPLAVFPLMGVYLFVPLASSKKRAESSGDWSLCLIQGFPRNGDLGNKSSLVGSLCVHEGKIFFKSPAQCFYNQEVRSPPTE